MGKRLNDRGADLLPNTVKSFSLGLARDIEFVLEAEGIIPTPPGLARLREEVPESGSLRATQVPEVLDTALRLKLVRDG